MPSAKERREARNEALKKAEVDRKKKREAEAAAAAVAVVAPAIIADQQSDAQKLIEFRKVEVEREKINKQIENLRQDAEELGMKFVPKGGLGRNKRPGINAHFIGDGDGRMMAKLKPLLEKKKKLNQRWQELHMVDPYWQENQAKKDFWGMLGAEGLENMRKKAAKEEAEAKKAVQKLKRQGVEEIHQINREPFPGPEGLLRQVHHFDEDDENFCLCQSLKRDGVWERVYTHYHVNGDDFSRMRCDCQAKHGCGAIWESYCVGRCQTWNNSGFCECQYQPRKNVTAPNAGGLSSIVCQHGYSESVCAKNCGVLEYNLSKRAQGKKASQQLVQQIGIIDVERAPVGSIAFKEEEKKGRQMMHDCGIRCYHSVRHSDDIFLPCDCERDATGVPRLSDAYIAYRKSGGRVHVNNEKIKGLRELLSNEEIPVGKAIRNPFGFCGHLQDAGQVVSPFEQRQAQMEKERQELANSRERKAADKRVVQYAVDFFREVDEPVRAELAKNLLDKM